MACLVDTCGWIEWLADGQLADAFAPYLADPAELIIPTTLQFELYKWARLPLLLTPLTYIHVGKAGKKRG